MSQHKKYWFKAKANGTGWSTPLRWQGWGVYAAMCLGIIYSFYSFAFTANVGQIMLGVWGSILVALPFVIIFGEPLDQKKR